VLYLFINLFIGFVYLKFLHEQSVPRDVKKS
jgi:hypothetical protein